MSLRAGLIASLLGVASLVHATPKVSGDDRRVVVELSNVEWSGAPAHAVGDAVEIGLAAGAESTRVDFDDRTVKRVSVTNSESPSLFIRLHHSKGTTERTAEQLKIEKTAGGLRVSFPREPVHTEAVEAKPETKKVEPKSVEAKATPKPLETKPIETKVETKVETKQEAPKVVTTVAAGLTPSATSERAINQAKPATTGNDAQYAATSTSSSRVWSTLLLICLGAGGLLAMIFRKKNGSGVKEEVFRVVGAHSLGGKSKLVLVDVQDRKFLLSVDDKTTTVVGSWTGDSKPAATSDAGPTEMGAALFDELEQPDEVQAMTSRNRDEEELPARPRRVTLSGSSSPAVAGLMKLRERHALTEDLQSGDPQADDEWAGMLLRATNRRAHS